MKTKTDIRSKQTVKSIWKKEKRKKKKGKKKKEKKGKTGTQTQEIFGMHSVLLVGVCKRLHALLSFSQLTAQGTQCLQCACSH